MAAQSLLEQPTRLQEKYGHRWLRFFFSVDRSADNISVIDLQRRAAWLGFALVLQSLNEIPHNLYQHYLKSSLALVPFVLFLGSFWALWLALRPASAAQQRDMLQQPPSRWLRLFLILTLILSLLGTFEFGRGIVMSFMPPQFTNDGASIDTNAAILLLQGRNPYTDSTMPEIVRRFHIPAAWTTPLRQGVFAGRLNYPSINEMSHALNQSLKTNTAPEFEAKVSYPALSFLTLVPFVLLKDYNVLPLYLLCYALLVLLLWRGAPRALRPWIVLLALANVPMWVSVVGSNLDILDSLLLVLAWQQRDHLWRSALFLGLALATKQIAWYFLPFYIILAWRQYSFKEMLSRVAIASGIGLAINLPFIIWNPHTWLAGVMAPIADPMFPMGVGLVNLGVTHLLPLYPGFVYSALEAIAMLLALLVYWRICRTHPAAAMLLAVLPLFLAWRSLSSYFYCIALPIFILVATRHTRTQPVRTSRALAVVEDLSPAL